MKALTVQQPWAWAIMHGGKDVENRTQAWRYRGPLAIHAGQRVSARGIKTVPSIVAAERMTPEVEGIREQMLAELEHGVVLGVVDLVDVHVQTGTSSGSSCCESWWAEASYDERGGRTRRDVVHLVLEHPRPIDVPMPCKGKLGLWTPPAEVLAQLHVVDVANWADEELVAIQADLDGLERTEA